MASEGEPEVKAPAAEPVEPLLPPGNPLRWRSAVFALLGLLPVFLLMASDRHFSFSVPVGAAGLAVAAFALLDMLGCFDDAEPAGASEASVSWAEVAPRLIELAAALVGLVASLRLAVAGVLPAPIASAALLVTGGVIWTVIALYRTAEALGVIADAAQRSLAQRHGFWLVLCNVLLYVPLLGSYSLSDPWETHYGEVAREMLARDDWISLWWAQDGWFWSKPVLDFWLQALGFSLTGVRFMPDQMLSAAGIGRFPQPEWPARLPVVLLSVLAIYLLYKAVAHTFGRRAGLLAGLALTTMPYWYLIAHQSMTDMPYVAPLTAALALFALALRAEPERRARTFVLRVGSRSLRYSGFHLLFAAILLTSLPQIVYLLTRNVTLQLSAQHFGFRWHLDEFFSGSGGGNCGLPGNEDCRSALPANRAFQPALAALLWSGVLGLLLYANRGERRVQRLLFLAAWYFTALSALAKGAPGLVLPIAVGVAALGATRRYRDFARAELVGLALVFACVCLPWYVQMFMRHGPPFTDRLLFHDMYKRAFEHVHDTNTGDDVTFRYYVWQLGYGLYPWTGFAALGLLWWLKFRDEAEDAASEQVALYALWFVISFAMFTISLTKFHHYVLPAVPPIAALIGVMLDHALGAGEPTRSRKSLAPYLLTLALSAGLLAYGGMRLFPGAVSGRLLGSASPPASPWQAALALACGLGLGVLAYRRWAQPVELPAPGSEQAAQGVLLGAGGLAAIAPILLCGRDLSTTVSGDIDASARFVHLFSYNYRRPWPTESLNFDGALLGFTLAAALLMAAFLLPGLRRHALLWFCALSVVWSAWGLDVYLIKAAPHWGQRETLLTYYATRKSADEPFVAYQMNWKGENFYTGNHVPAFVSSGAKFKSWLAEQRNKGVRVMFFTTEHGRIATLKSELGSVRELKLLNTPKDNNKFVLARVEL